MFKMKDLELNKIAASILLAGLIAMLCGFFTNIFYQPKTDTAVRGYQVEVKDAKVKTEIVVEEEIIIADVMKLADLTKGTSIAKKCGACHSFNNGGPNKVGPNLWNIMGAMIASNETYNYSSALKTKGGNWTYDDMYQFLNKPKKYAPGTKMSFAGLKKQKDLASIIEYLRVQSDNPLPLPN